MPDVNRLRRDRLTGACRGCVALPCPPLTHQTADEWQAAHHCSDDDDEENRSAGALARGTATTPVDHAGTLWIRRRSWRAVVGAGRIVAAVVAIVIATRPPASARVVATLIAARRLAVLARWAGGEPPLCRRFRRQRIKAEGGYARHAQHEHGPDRPCCCHRRSVGRRTHTEGSTLSFRAGGCTFMWVTVE